MRCKRWRQGNIDLYCTMCWTTHTLPFHLTRPLMK